MANQPLYLFYASIYIFIIWWSRLLSVRSSILQSRQRMPQKQLQPFKALRLSLKIHKGNSSPQNPLSMLQLNLLLQQIRFIFTFYFISVLLTIFGYSLLVLWSLRSLENSTPSSAQRKSPRKRYSSSHHNENTYLRALEKQDEDISDQMLVSLLNLLLILN